MKVTTSVDLRAHVAMRATSGLTRVLVIELGHTEVGELEVAAAVKE